MKKFNYFTYNIILNKIPKIFFEKRLKRLITKISNYDADYIKYRVGYYNKLSEPFSLNHSYDWSSFKKKNPVFDVEDNTIVKKSIGSAYFYDFRKHLIFFNRKNKFCTAFYDLTKIPKEPTFVKSRPISSDNQNSILLKLDKVRHFRFIDDALKFENKKNAIVFRGQCHVPHRQKFIEEFYNLPNSDFGDVMQSNQNKPYYKNYLSVSEQLKYKYILSIEGNDVATNLKWIMNSNSLCFMIKPKYETWFMEGTLIPNYHYVLLKDDYSDIQEKMDYYNNNPEKALKIIKNANTYVNQFKDKKREGLISLLVMKKYFDLAT